MYYLIVWYRLCYKTISRQLQYVKKGFWLRNMKNLTGNLQPHVFIWQNPPYTLEIPIQFIPPFLGAGESHFRVFVCVPKPHVFEHRDNVHAPHCPWTKLTQQFKCYRSLLLRLGRFMIIGNNWHCIFLGLTISILYFLELLDKRYCIIAYQTNYIELK